MRYRGTGAAFADGIGRVAPFEQYRWCRIEVQVPLFRLGNPDRAGRWRETIGGAERGKLSEQRVFRCVVLPNCDPDVVTGGQDLAP